MVLWGCFFSLSSDTWDQNFRWFFQTLVLLRSIITIQSSKFPPFQLLPVFALGIPSENERIPSQSTIPEMTGLSKLCKGMSEFTKPLTCGLCGIALFTVLVCASISLHSL